MKNQQTNSSHMSTEGSDPAFEKTPRFWTMKPTSTSSATVKEWTAIVLLAFGIDSYISQKIKKNHNNDNWKQEQVERHHKHRPHHNFCYPHRPRFQCRITNQQQIKPQQFLSRNLLRLFLYPSATRYSATVKNFPYFAYCNCGFMLKNSFNNKKSEENGVPFRILLLLLHKISHTI